MQHLKHIFLTFAFIFLCGGVQAKEYVLCADIGCTRVKASVLSEDVTLEELKNAEVIAFDSSEWWNETFPHIFNSQTPGSLPQRLKHPYRRISFGISGPVVNKGTYLNVTKAIPRDLRRQCEAVAKLPVTVENDASMWVKGALFWNQLLGKEIKYPCLGVTFGTAIGAVILISPTEWINTEVSYIDCEFKRLHAISKEQPIDKTLGRKPPHKPIGKAFFDWASEQDPAWSQEQLSRVFTNRVIAFFIDMREYMAIELGLELNSLMIGGGNSRLLRCEELHNAMGNQVILLNPEHIEYYGVSPDIISLLGGLDNMSERTIKMVPQPEELIKFLEHQKKANQ